MDSDNFQLRVRVTTALVPTVLVRWHIAGTLGIRCSFMSLYGRSDIFVNHSYQFFDFHHDGLMGHLGGMLPIKRYGSRRVSIDRHPTFR